MDIALGETGLKTHRISLGSVKFGRNTNVKYPEKFLIPNQSKNNGLKKEENNFVSGAMRGENIFYYSNGKIRRRIFFDYQGNRSGEWVEFHVNGMLKEKKNY